MLRGVANSILARNHNEPDTPPLIGPDWSRRFLKRHPEYVKRKSKPLAHDRKNTINKCIGKYRMLISDGYNSHLEFDFVEYCWNNYIVPFCLPPHTTHFLQPLDVVCFQPLKHYHVEAIDRAVRTGDSDFSKYE